MSSKQILFVTGTDTEIGKTKITVGLLEKAGQLGLKTLGVKPIASGCINTQDGLRNEDALLHQAASSYPCAYDVINPFCFEPAIAPHIAAEQEGIELSIENINERLQLTLSKAVDFIVIEGAGGWHTPLNQQTLYSDWVKDNRLSVILVVGIRLGAINHALLTQESIINSRLTVVGWVANCVDPDMPHQQDNIDYLMKHMKAPCLGVVPFLADGSSAVDYLSLPTLI